MRVLREYERGVVFRLGRVIEQKGPGLVMLIPAVDRMVRVSLRTVTLRIPHQEVITRDNVPVKVAAVVYFRVIDPTKSVVEVENHVNATLQIAQTTLRSVLGKAELDSLLSERERLNESLQQIIDEQTEPWGIKVSVVEIKDVEIPERMQHALARQAEAERNRRAKVINSEGEFQAADELAEAADVIQPNPVTLQLRYLQALSEISANQGSTIVFPLPLDLIRPLLEKGSVRRRRQSSRCLIRASSRQATDPRRSRCRRRGRAGPLRPRLAVSASALLAIRVGSTRTTSQARPVISHPDHEPGGIEGPAAHAMRGGGGERVVVVVPGLAKRERHEPEQVARLVVRLEATPPEEVAERVDAVGHVVHHQHAHPAAPEQPGQGRRERAADRIAERERQREPAERPDQEGAVDPAHHGVVHEVGRIAAPRPALGVNEEPAHVRVDQALEGALPAALVPHVGAVRIALLVREGVVLAVVGDPGDHRTLDRHRAERR